MSQLAHGGSADLLKGKRAKGPVDSFSHLTVQVSDLDRSEKFYQEVFGLDLIGRDLVNEEGPNSVLAMNSGQCVVLVQVPKVEPLRPNTHGIHHGWYLTTSL